jgi:preprotein translocase subunit SecF
MTNISIGYDLLRTSANSGFDFMRHRKWALGLSLLMVTICVVSIGSKGLKQGLDFRGGTLTEVRFDQNPGIDNLRQSLAGRLTDEFQLQETGKPGEFVIGTQLANDEEGMQQTRQLIEDTLGEHGTFEVRSSGFVGPRAGAEMRNRAMMATLGAFAGMLIYIAFRFKWISGVAAIIATIHDVVITVGIFSLTDRAISLNIVAALLTLIGYSMNDKIVVFDRVRENQLIRVPGRSFPQLINDSINQTLSRTILTAGPTLLACLSLYFLGGEVLNGIAFALSIGILAGTYSSVFVASAILVMWQEKMRSS